MKKLFITIGIVVSFIFAGQVVAEEMDHKGHDHSKMEHPGHKMEHPGHKMDHSGYMGKMIREISVDGYGFMYHLIDMKARMKDMEGMEHMVLALVEAAV